MKVPILTYHSMNVLGNEYENNDHVALFNDLRLITHLGLRIIPLYEIVEQLRNGRHDLANCVAVTFDDGADLDYFDLTHPTWGIQRSMLNIMKDFMAEFGADTQPSLHATSFVIVSPEARKQLDHTCTMGYGWWTDDWWPEAVSTGLLSIANHSWDHNHATLERVAQKNQEKGSFLVIDTYEDADAQIRQATQYLMHKTNNPGVALFAYPYGEYNEYLVDHYLPKLSTEHGLMAAFTTEPRHVSENEHLWKLPRYVCGRDWKTPEQLARILKVRT